MIWGAIFYCIDQLYKKIEILKNYFFKKGILNKPLLFYE